MGPDFKEKKKLDKMKVVFLFLHSKLAFLNIMCEMHSLKYFSINSYANITKYKF